jgi:hypothetical protein
MFSLKKQTCLMTPPFDYVSDEERILVIEYLRAIQAPYSADWGYSRNCDDQAECHSSLKPDSG